MFPCKYRSTHNNARGDRVAARLREELSAARDEAAALEAARAAAVDALTEAHR